jgi:uncharacterized membrane protein YcaP (DUF421 family)
MELAKELLQITGRILTILPLLLAITLVMGKRSIGELPVFDFLVIITMGAVVGADIADPSIEHIHTAVAIILIGLFQWAVSKWSIKNRRFGRMVTFEPTIVIKDGQFLVRNMARIRYSMDNVLQMLREKDVFDVSDVHLGIVEANGKLTVHKRPGKEMVTVEDMGIQKLSSGVAYPVIVEGKIHANVLKQLNLNEKWLKQQLSNRGLTDISKIFFASVKDNKEIHVSLVEGESAAKPSILH